MADLLMSAGAAVDARTYDDATPLHVAAQEGQKELVELPASRGARIDAEKIDGYTPTDAARHGNHQEVVELLGHPH